MASWSLKKPELLEVSESSLRIIRNNLDNIGISIPLKEADEKKIFEWAIRQKEHCTEKEYHTRFKDIRQMNIGKSAEHYNSDKEKQYTCLAENVKSYKGFKAFLL